jgi:hypothetical protein
MRQCKTSVVLLAMFAIVAMAGCGGGGNGFGAAAVPPLTITTTSLPSTLSGERVDFPVELGGGCGGPYVISVIGGALPPGVGTDVSVPDGGEPRHHLTGLVLEKGTFDFTLQVTDTGEGCTPFLTTVAQYTWVIGEGDLQIVDATPAIITDPGYKDRFFADVDCLPTVVYGTLTSMTLIAAGGQGPYVCSVYDDPSDPLDDGGLPFGMNMAVSSCSIVGTPSSVGPGGQPHRITFRVTDSAGNTATRTLQWTIDTPPIIISNPSLADGEAGTGYSDGLQIVDGVPPFGFEFVDVVPGPDAEGTPFSNIDYTVTPPVVLSLDSNFNPYGVAALTLADTGPSGNKLHGGSIGNYPPTNDAGPFMPFPSEGMYLIETGGNGGSLSGVPRRVGTFTLLTHAYSLLVPNNRGQHAFKPYTHTIAQPAPIAINPAMALEGTFDGLPGDGFPTLPEAEQTILYNPDSATHPANGMQCLASGGVPQDGYQDSPHFSTRMQDITEVAGRYNWAGDNNWDGEGAITGLEVFDASGLFGTETAADANGLPRQGRRLIELSVNDSILPDAINLPQSQVFGISVGPDTMIITHSTSSLSQTASYWSASQRHEWNDYQQTILKFNGFSSGPVRGVLEDTDLAAGHTVPSIAFSSTPANQLGALLSAATGGDATLDIHRPTVVATGWWDDSFGLNPKGARHGKHSDWAMGYAYYGMYGYSYSNHGNYQPSVANLDLPAAQVTANTSEGIYADGGRLYVFESSNRFGIFIIREDTKMYVPFAMEKDSTVEGFGDGLLRSPALGVNSGLQTVQMTVSPNGRFAALKLKRDAQNLYEQAPDSQVVLVSLSGEKIFGESAPGANDGETYKIIGSGSAATGSGSRILHAPSMALTNSHLYFLIGSRSATSTSTSSTPMYYQSFSGHYFMNYDVLGGATQAGLMTSSDGNWTQGSNVPMQTTYQHTGPNYSSGMWETYTYYGLWPYHRYWQEDGMNLQEHGVAPTPFRVSANGEAVAFMAAEDMYSTYNADIYNTYAWVCYDGSEPRRATSSRYHAMMGSGRGYVLSHGPNEYGMWGRYNGPTTGLEISDDGLAVAFVYNTNSGSIYSTQSATSSNNSWMRYRDNIHLTRTTSSSKWASSASTTERNVTGTIFGGSHRWRFGALAFTGNTNPDFEGGYDVDDPASQGLVFWAGAPIYQGNSTSYTYNQSYQTAGTMYATALSGTTITSMLAAAEGGSDDGVKTYSSSTVMSPSSTTGSTTSANDSSNRRYGVMQLMGGFMSKNRRFMYVCSYGALSTGDATSCKLVGLNVSTMDSGSFNAHTNAQGDIPASWPSRRGFLGNYIYYPYYPLYYGYAPARKQGLNRHVMVDETGVVYWSAGYQYQGPGRYYYYGGPPNISYYYGAYGYGGVGLYGFNADMNGRVAALHYAPYFANSTSTQYLQNYLEVSRDGTRLAYIPSANYYYDLHNGERIVHVKDLNFDTADGSIDGAFSQTADTVALEGSNGRAGEAMAFPPGNSTDLWYAFKAGAGNETAKEMVKASLQPDGTWHFTRFSSLPGRINVLHGGR